MWAEVRQNYNGSRMSSPEQITKGIADSSFILVYQLKQSVFMEDELLPTTSYQAVHRTVE